MAVIDEFVALMKWKVDNKELKEANKELKDQLKSIRKFALVVSGAVSSLGVFSGLLNRNTARVVAMSEAVGASSEFVENFSNAFKSLGFDFENTVDLIEEMNNKFGELKGLKTMTSAQDALKLLKLDFKEIQKLAPEEQFREIFDTALALEDQQIAVSAVDMLLGAEANKILGFLQTYDMNLSEILDRQEKLNMLTEEGREGAVAWTVAWQDLTTLAGSLAAEVSGLVGKALQPLVTEMVNWTVENRKLIKQKVKEAVERIVKALKTLWRIAKGIFGIVKSITDVFGGLGNTLKFLGITISAIKLAGLIGALSKLLKAGAAVEALKLFSAKSPIILLTLALILLGLVIEDLIVFFEGGESALGDLGEAFANVWVDDVEPFIAGLLGISNQDFQLIKRQAIEDVENWFSVTLPNAIKKFEFAIENTSFVAVALFQKVRDQIGEFFDSVLLRTKNSLTLISLAVLNFLTEQFNKLKMHFNSIVDFTKNAFSKLGDFIVNSFKNAFDSALRIGSEALRQVTGFLGKFGITTDLNLAVPSRTAPGSLVTPATVAGASTANTSNSVRVNNQINITQQPGESATVLAERVSDTMGKDFANAVRNLDSGVVY